MSASVGVISRLELLPDLHFCRCSDATDLRLAQARRCNFR